MTQTSQNQLDRIKAHPRGLAHLCAALEREYALAEKQEAVAKNTPDRADARAKCQGILEAIAFAVSGVEADVLCMAASPTSILQGARMRLEELRSALDAGKVLPQIARELTAALDSDLRVALERAEQAEAFALKPPADWEAQMDKVFCKGVGPVWEILDDLEAGTVSRGFAREHLRGRVAAFVRSLFNASYAAPVPPPWRTAGLAAIAHERGRQIDVEGWTQEHDRQHSPLEILKAGIAYLLLTRGQLIPLGELWASPPSMWPWAREWWKPADNPQRNLEKGGALVVAALDRCLADPAWRCESCSKPLGERWEYTADDVKLCPACADGLRTATLPPVLRVPGHLITVAPIP